MARKKQHIADDPSASGRRRSGDAPIHGLQPAPWERMLEETPKAYAAFRVFRDQGVQRSYAATARTLGKHESQIRRWAGPFRWSCPHPSRFKARAGPVVNLAIA